MELYILTKPFLDGTNIVEQMHAWAATHLNVTGAAGRARLPTLYVMSGHIEEEKYNQLYKVRRYGHVGSPGWLGGQVHAQMPRTGSPSCGVAALGRVAGG